MPRPHLFVDKTGLYPLNSQGLVRKKQVALHRHPEQSAWHTAGV